MQHYKIVDTIGQGSFGMVYLVTDNLGKKYALKKIHVDPFEIQQALDQIEIMKKFQHPNLVKIYDDHLDEEKEELEIIMEYCQEGDLLHYFKKKNKQLTVDDILNIFQQIVKAFIVMSVRGVIHRDLKPQNLLIGEGHVIKIADFGCARCVGEIDMSKIDNFSLDKGTFIYASPQQLKNEKYSFKCDVWSAGCLLYYLHYGYHPFFDSKAHNTLELVRKMTQNKQIQIEKSTDPTIAKLLSLTLIYQDRQRASWRQLWLSRIFSPKISDIRGYVDYLKTITHITNWVAKQFWKIRKQYPITNSKQEVFVYFTIKLQFTNLKMALNILKKTDKYRYLFDEASFKGYEPNQAQFNEVKKMYIEHEKYFATIKKSMQSKDSFKIITEKECNRTSGFVDLDKSIRVGYKILKEVKDTIDQGKSHFWVVLAKWINFQRWLSFQKAPTLEQVTGEMANGVKLIREEVEKYEMGVLE